VGTDVKADMEFLCTASAGDDGGVRATIVSTVALPGTEGSGPPGGGPTGEPTGGNRRRLVAAAAEPAEVFVASAEGSDAVPTATTEVASTGHPRGTRVRSRRGGQWPVVFRPMASLSRRSNVSNSIAAGGADLFQEGVQL